MLDHDPQRASDMCDSIIEFYNQKVSEMHTAKDYEMVVTLKDAINRKYNELDSIKTELNEIKKGYGILDFDEQVPEITRGYMNALAAGRSSSSDTRKIQDLYNNMAEKGSDAAWLESRLDFLVNSVDSLTTDYDFYLSEYKNKITYSHIVEYPFPADKKSYPVRWLIVSFSAISAIFLALLLFLIIDYRKKE